MGVIVEECKHGLTRQWCSYCKDRPPVEVKNARLWNRRAEGDNVGIADPAMEAQFDSTCPACGGEIESGDIIGKRNDEWLCAGCAYTVDVQTAKQIHPSGGGKHA